MNEIGLLHDPAHEAFLAAHRTRPCERRADLDRNVHAGLVLKPRELVRDGDGADTQDIVRHPKIPGIILVLHRVLVHHRGARVLAVRVLDLAAELRPPCVGPAVQHQTVVAVHLHGVALTREAHLGVVVGLCDRESAHHGRMAEDELQTRNPIKIVASHERLPALE